MPRRSKLGPNASYGDRDDDFFNSGYKPARKNNPARNEQMIGRERNFSKRNNMKNWNPRGQQGSKNVNDDDLPSRQPTGTRSLATEEEITDTNAHFFSKKSLKDPAFWLSGEKDQALHEALCRGASINRPSRIQSLAWPQILSGNHTIVGDQTGSGKTLAYLIGLLNRALTTPSNPENGTPKILILAPTAELADQVHNVCLKISQTVPFKTMVVTASGKYTTTIRDQIRLIQRQPMDVLVSTPGRISTILRTRNSGLDLSKLQAIVLDEVDILMIDETFGPQLRTVGAAAPRLDQTQFVFVTATLPDSIVQTIESEFPGVVQVRGPGLHRLAPSLKENLVDVSVPAEHNRNEELCFDVKSKQLLKALRQNRCRRTLVFCNTVESCRGVENLLNRKDRKGRVFEVLAYHNAMTPESRNSNLRVFSHGRKGEGKDHDDVDYILICTDRAARGVDFDASSIDHVVIFDFPKDPAEYIRRVGRTARAGRVGTSTVFAYGWQLPIARSVMGKKLESFTVAATDVKESDDDYEYRRDRRTKKTKDAMIKEKIESGRLWEE
jgi:ATP-dependent RNA helicase DDX18/HAS1